MYRCVTFHGSCLKIACHIKLRVSVVDRREEAFLKQHNLTLQLKMTLEESCSSSLRSTINLVGSNDHAQNRHYNPLA